MDSQEHPSKIRVVDATPTDRRLRLEFRSLLGQMIPGVEGARPGLGSRMRGPCGRLIRPRAHRGHRGLPPGGAGDLSPEDA